MKHAPLNSVDDKYPCWHKNESAQVFRNQTLAARQTTDALMLDFTQCLQAFGDDYAVLSTLAQALLISGAKLLELDSRELGTMVVPAARKVWGQCFMTTSLVEPDMFRNCSA